MVLLSAKNLGSEVNHRLGIESRATTDEGRGGATNILQRGNTRASNQVRTKCHARSIAAAHNSHAVIFLTSQRGRAW